MNVTRKLKVTGVLLTACVLTSAPVISQAQEPDWMGEIQQIQVFLDLMQQYFGLIESVHDVSGDAERSAIWQLYKIEEIYKDRGERAKAVAVFREVLSETDNPAIRNATYMMLGEALKETGRADEAVDVLREGLTENIRNAR